METKDEQVDFWLDVAGEHERLGEHGAVDHFLQKAIVVDSENPEPLGLRQGFPLTSFTPDTKDPNYWLLLALWDEADGNEFDSDRMLDRAVQAEQALIDAG